MPRAAGTAAVRLHGSGSEKHAGADLELGGEYSDVRDGQVAFTAPETAEAVENIDRNASPG